MSLWPIICIECLECDKRVFASEYDLDGYDQPEFFDALARDGWRVPGKGKARDIEADDDGIVLGCCPECKRVKV